MALLTQNRNRIPLVATAPVSGLTPGIRGDLRMIETPGDLVIYVCTTAGGVDPVSGSPFTSASVWSTITAT